MARRKDPRNRRSLLRQRTAANPKTLRNCPAIRFGPVLLGLATFSTAPMLAEDVEFPIVLAAPNEPTDRTPDAERATVMRRPYAPKSPIAEKYTSARGYNIKLVESADKKCSATWLDRPKIFGNAAGSTRSSRKPAKGTSAGRKKLLQRRILLTRMTIPRNFASDISNLARCATECRARRIDSISIAPR